MADTNVSSSGVLLDKLQLQADKATPEQIAQVASTTFANDPEAIALLNATLVARNLPALDTSTGTSNIVNSFVDKSVSSLTPSTRTTDSDVNIPITETVASTSKQNVQVTPEATAAVGLTPEQVQNMIDAQAAQQTGQTEAEFNSILDYIRSGSTAQKEQIAAQLRTSLQDNLARIREEGIETGAAFDEAERGVRSQGALAGKQLKERLSQIGITGRQTEKFFQQAAGQQMQAIGGLAVEEAKATTARNRLVNDIKSASESELAGLLAGVDSNEFAAIVNQLNADREFDLKSDLQKQQLVSSELENQLLTLQLDAFPEQLAAELKGLNQNLELGKISLEEAQYQIDQLKDPESIYNQLQDFEVRMAELNIANADLETQQRVKELNKKVASLSKVYTDPNEALKAEVEMKGLLIELDELDKTLAGEDTEGASSQDVRSWLLSLNNAGWETLQVAIEDNKELLIQYDLLTYANSLLDASRSGNTDK